MSEVETITDTAHVIEGPPELHSAQIHSTQIDSNQLKRKLSVGSVDTSNHGNKHCNHGNMSVDEAYEPTLEEHIGGSIDDESSILNDEDERNHEEVAVLKKEGEVPIEELMAMYGFPNKNIDYIKFKEDSQDDSGSDIDSESEQRLHLFDKDDWKKEILIGPDYQADIPNFVENQESPDTSDGADRSGGADRRGGADPAADTLLWSPGQLLEHEVEQYLSLVYTQHCNHANQEDEEQQQLPVADGTRDDEEALYNLHKNGYKIDEALIERSKHTSNHGDTGNTGNTGADVKEQVMKPWLESECQAFENGLKIYGKQFNLIQKKLVPGRSVSEIIQFYYLWKKTERYDIFIQYSRLGTKRFIFNPGQPLDMDRSNYICNNTQQHNTESQDSEHLELDSPSLPCT